MNKEATHYEKDLNELKEQILKEGNTLVSKRDLLERFCEIDKEYNGDPWNLLQILYNINVLIGEEPYEELDFVQPHKRVGITVTDFADKCRECGRLRKNYKEKNKNNK